MAQEILMPKLAMAMSEGTVNAWQFAQGDMVEKGQILLEIETEKVSYEIESTGSGYLNIVISEGQTVPVEQVIGHIAKTKEELDSLGEKVVAFAAEPAGVAVAEQAPQVVQGETHSATTGGRIIASPVAKKLAKLNGLDISEVAGTGPNGRIVKRDVLATIEASQTAPVSGASSTLTPAVETGPKVKASIPLKGMRKAIADNMMLSLSSTAQMSSTMEVDATELVNLRKRLVAKAEKIGHRVSFTDLFALIIARAARQVPIVNASIVGEEIKVWEEINLGIAIATEINEYESGLFVPVIKDAGRKSLFEIGREVKDLSGRARAGELTPEDMQDGTLTLSSAAFAGGLVSSTPILNPGQALLVQPGPIVEKPVVQDGEIDIRSMMSLNFTFDHRIVDGIPIGKLAVKIAELMADPELLL